MGLARQGRPHGSHLPVRLPFITINPVFLYLILVCLLYVTSVEPGCNILGAHPGYIWMSFAELFFSIFPLDRVTRYALVVFGSVAVSSFLSW